MTRSRATNVTGLLATGFALAACASSPPTDTNEQSVDGNAVVDALLAQMTLDEKIGQMTLFSANWAVTGPVSQENYADEIRAGRVGAMFSVYTTDRTCELQRMAVEETRLGIPLLFGFDVIHGHRTIFPMPLGEAASWDLDAIEKSARIAATEAAAEGLHWTFAPMVDVARDPRWGRIAESAGEDPWLGSAIARARVRGFQGDDLAATNTVLATAKHFAAYGAAQAGRDYHTTDMSDRTLREIHLPPFRAAVEAGAASLMTSFNALNGVPTTGNRYLLEKILRNEWQFNGFVVSDYTSINEMVAHGFAADDADAGRLAIRAGVDMDMQGAVYLSHLGHSVDAGTIPVEFIDAAVRRILEAKSRLGILNDPYRYCDSDRQAANVLTDAHLEAARDVARRSLVLLKNDDLTLPIGDDVSSIAVVGPLADSKADLLGSWAAAGDRHEQPVSVLDALQQRLGDRVAVHHATGGSYRFDAPADPESVRQAVSIAKNADVVIAVLGEHWKMSGEAASRTDLTLPGNQQALLEALVATGKPIVLVLLNGRPLALEWADRNVPAILEAWYPGTMGGHAIADLLFGDYNPSGKLPVTFPRNVGQVPLHYDLLNTGRPQRDDKPDEKFVSRYLETPNRPLYPFGHGLSYTQFDYSEIELSTPVMRGAVPLVASVVITNRGAVAGEEVVQLYLRDRVASVARPVRQLRGFRKIGLAPGESRTLRFTIDLSMLSFYGRDMTYGAEAGIFDVFIGTSSADTRAASFTLLEPED